MGNVFKREKQNCTPTGLRYHSSFEIEVEQKRNIERNNNEWPVNSLIEMVHDNVIGRKLILKGPFGRRRCVYMDHTASGQPLNCIEDLIRKLVLPFYGNTHTTATVTSSQMTSYREEARDIIRESVGAEDNDAVIFCGSGATRAVQKLVNVLALNDRPLVVFVGPYEHHSNILPWKEKQAKMVFVPETSCGLFDFDFLATQLKVEAVKAKKNNKLLIGSFSVASNVTGIPVDDIKITKLLHQYGALSFWDYSSAAAHVGIYMNPGTTAMTHKDAIFFSGHKFVGGPQTPGVLVAKRFIFDKKRASDGGGGGSVFFVTKYEHLYLKDIEAREESGTPAIVETIRLGLAFSLKNAITTENILTIERSYVSMVMERWSKVPEIRILAQNNYPRTATISFLIQQLDIVCDEFLQASPIKNGLYLHHNFVVALLNDLFGIQTRGGCGCAGPYSQSLLGIDSNLAHRYKDLLLDENHRFRSDSHLFGRHEVESPCEIYKPGFVRVSISFCSSRKDVEYVIAAVTFVARKGFMLLPFYKCNVTTGAYCATDFQMTEHHNRLKSVVFDSKGANLKRELAEGDTSDIPSYDASLQEADNIVNNIRDTCNKFRIEKPTQEFHSQLRWFVHRKEAFDLLQMRKTIKLKIPPFIVATYESPNSADLNSVTPHSVLHQLSEHH